MTHPKPHIGDLVAEMLARSGVEYVFGMPGGQTTALHDGISRRTDRIRHIPCVIVQGRYDLPCPARTAWDLAQAWPQAELRMVLAGHSAFEPNITAELVAAADRFAGAA